MEDHAGVRHHLFRLGLDLSSDPRRGARSPAAASRQHAILYCRRRALRMDAAEGHAVPVSPRVACGFGSGGFHLCCRLWLAGRWRATRSARSCCGPRYYQLALALLMGIGGVSVLVSRSLSLSLCEVPFVLAGAVALVIAAISRSISSAS